MKLIAAFLFFISVIFSLDTIGQNTITTSTLTQTSFCAGGNVVVQYTSTGTFPLGCTFSAELSDASGNFGSPVTVGSMPLNTGVIAGTIPTNTTFGINYRIRVIASNPATIGSVSSTSLVITSTAVTATIVSNPSSSQVCQGDSVSLWVTFNQAYHWSTGETSQTIYVTQSGTYTCTVTNYITGCEVSSTPKMVTVHPTPVVNFGSGIEQCVGDLVTLNAGSGFSSYLWNDSTTAHSMIIDSNGTYSVVVHDAFGCIGGDTVSAVFHPNPVVNLGADTSLCGSSLLLSTGIGFNSYNWNNGLSFNPGYLATASGIYYVSVTDSNGCSDRDTIQVHIYALPSVNLGNDLSACGNSITLNAGAGYSAYDWNNGADTSQFFQVNTSGTYILKVSNPFGCFDTDTINVSLHALPYIDLGPDIQLTQIDSMVLDAGTGYASYQWTTGQNSEVIVIGGWDHPLGQDTIGVTITDGNGCTNSDQIVITIVPVNQVDEFTAYPNPFHDVLSIVSSQNLAETKPVFYDMLGRYYYPAFTIHSSSMIIKRGDLADGCYVLLIDNKEGLHTAGKFIVN